MFGSFNLKQHMSEAVAKQNAVKDEFATVVREDGKEFIIRRDLVANHVNRGFTVKDKKNQPTEEELKAATGYRNTRVNIATNEERPLSAANEVKPKATKKKK